MIRRFNYTARKRISKSDAVITFDRSTSPFSFEAQLNFEKYNIEPNARVFVEAFRGNSFMRFDYGTVEEPAVPSDRRLSEIEGAEFARFRVKVVDDESGQLFATTSSLKPDQSSKDKPETLLPLYLTDIGNQVWKLKFDNEGVRLQLNQQISGADEVIKDPAFHALVFPAVIREVLIYIIFVERWKYQEEDEGDEESPWNNWCKFVKDFYPEEYPGPCEKEDIDNEKYLEWIEGVVDSFCSKHNVRDLYLNRSKVKRGT